MPEPIKAEPIRDDSLRRSRKGTVVSATGNDDHTERMLEDLDAGFDSIVQPEEPAAALSPAPPIVVAAPRFAEVPGDDSGWSLRPPAELDVGSLPDPEDPVTARPSALAAPAFAEAVAAFADPDRTPTVVVRKSEIPDPPTVTHAADLAAVRELFEDLAQVHARPLRDFLLEVAWGEPRREWLEICAPAARSLARATDALEMPELGVALQAFLDALHAVPEGGTIDAAARAPIQAAYQKLIDMMPGVFGLEGERGRREAIIVRSLLLQVRGVHPLALERIYAAGLSRLDMFYAARPRDLVEATGLPEPVAAQICDKFQEYRREVVALPPGDGRAEEREQLEGLVKKLAQVHADYEKASSGWSKEAIAARAPLRKERAEVSCQIDVLLAHLGEVDRLHDLGKLPFAQRIEELQRFLDDARKKAALS